MTAINTSPTADRLTVLLGRVRAKGVRIWAEEGHLRYRAPKNALTDHDIEQLRTSKGEILSLLQHDLPPSLAPTAPPARRTHLAPLAYSQLHHWNFYQLSHQPAFRHLLAVQRLAGPLDIEATRRTIAAIIHRHDSLRTRIILHGGIPMQEIANSVEWTLDIQDLTTAAASGHELEINRQIEQIVMEPINVSIGPLFAVKLLRLSPSDHILIVAMEHIISDMWSINLFMRDFLRGYAQATRSGTVAFAKLPMEFSDYASWQKSQKTNWLKRHSPYWEDCLRSCHRLRFPDDPPPPHCLTQNNRSGWTIATIPVEGALHTRLQQWCREQRTTVVMSIFTAYVALVLRWCRAAETLIRFETNGRVDPKLADTIGYFTSPLYIRVSLTENDTVADLLRRVTQAYCSAHEHADFSYIESREPRPDFTRNTAFNWIPSLADHDTENTLNADALKLLPFDFENPRLQRLERDTEPFAVFFAQRDRIDGGIWFPLDRFSRATMEMFSKHLRAFVDELIKHPGQRVLDLALDR